MLRLASSHGSTGKREERREIEPGVAQCGWKRAGGKPPVRRAGILRRSRRWIVAISPTISATSPVLSCTTTTSLHDTQRRRNETAKWPTRRLLPSSASCRT